MKLKILSVLAFIMFFSLFANAQQSSNAEPEFTKSNFIVNVGAAFGWYNYGGDFSGVSAMPAFTFGIEKGILDIPKIGVVSVGGIVGWKHATYNDEYYGWYLGLPSYYDTYTENDYIIATRGIFHQSMLKIKKLDLYAGIDLGVRLIRQKYYDPPTNTTSTYNGTDFLGGAFIGARYYLLGNFSAYTELGYGIGYFTLGLSYKF
ncbi:MAG: hypothetical protein ABR968_02325 [Bacteroidales bacterium]|jgi:hypothetical protein